MDTDALEAVQAPLKASYREARHAPHHARYRCRDEQQATLLKLTERYCVILPTLRRGQDLAARIREA